MASSFLERKAKEREEIINSQYNQTSKPKIVNNTANTTNQAIREKASPFLQRKAAERNQVLANNPVISISAAPRNQTIGNQRTAVYI